MGGVAIVVFSDLVDSTALLAALGDDRMDRVRRAHVEDVTGVVTAAGGRVVKTLGDGVMASFDSALGALRAAAGIQAAVESLDAAHGRIGIAARVGVAAGEPIPDGADLHGMTVVIASRLSSAAGTGEVLVQDLVHGLVASRDGVDLDVSRDYDLKGVPVPVRASRLLWRELALDGADGEEPTPASAAGRDELPRSDGIRLHPVLAAYAEEPLIGRDDEIGSLREATAPRPGRRAVLILGEPGIGKTRHAAAAAAEAHAAGATVVLARCPPEAVVPFEPWVQAIGELALAGDRAWRGELARAAGPELSALVPELGEYAVAGERAASGELVAAEGGRYRVLRGIGAVLACAAGEAPLQVVLDDAHWCDPASAQALKHLLDSGPAHLVLVVTARDRELGRGHPVSRVLAELRRTGDLAELRLSGLDAPGLAALVGARVGRAITPQLAAQLHDRTAGNPFFAGELARDLDALGALHGGEELDAAPVPDAVTDLVDERLARLDLDTERLLSAVAAIGPSASVALATRAAGIDPEAAERAVRAALSERLVDEIAAAQPTVAFPHALIREALIAGTGDAARARLHLEIARALEEDAEAEPADLARHYGLAVELTGPEPAIAAYRAAAAAAAEGHDHEQAAANLRSVLSLLPDADEASRATALLELGEQELLSADLVRARDSFREAIAAARATEDAVTLARAALGFAGGDIGFGWEVGTDDPAAVEQLREALEALGEEESRLALRVTFRLVFMSVFSEDEAALLALARRAEALGERLGDIEALVLARCTAFAARFACCPEPLTSLDQLGDSLEILALAEECDRDDLLFRVMQWFAVYHYVTGQIPECEEAIERTGRIAERLGSPRFTWEVDLNRGLRLIDRGDREGGEALVRRAGTIVRRLRPDIHASTELMGLMVAEWIYDGQTATARVAYEAMEEVAPWGFTRAISAFSAAVDGDRETARQRVWKLLEGDLRALRYPDGHLPASVCTLALAVTLSGDRAAGERLRPLFESFRPYLVAAPPTMCLGHLPEWHVGRLELLAGRHDAAVEELRGAVVRADALEIAWLRGMARVDLSRALHAHGELAEARRTLAEAEALAQRYGMRWVADCATEASAELEGRPPVEEVGGRVERSRPIRALATRGRRRALAVAVGGLDDAELERRFAEPRRQRALLKAMARGFQPAQAGGFSGTIAYELEPVAIAPPPDAPWRWAVEVDADAGRARLREPAPLDAAVTVHFGLADWVRVIAGVQDSLAAMVAGRCSVEGDLRLAVRLEAMFGAQ
jgi:eukaryotic-like serine/threonine-protein kinase